MPLELPENKLPTLRSFESLSSNKRKLQQIKMDLDFKNNE
jgi:hypothetical protein